MTEYFIFLSACIGLTLSLIGVWLWLDHQRRSPADFRKLIAE